MNFGLLLAKGLGKREAYNNIIIIIITHNNNTLIIIIIQIKTMVFSLLLSLLEIIIIS